MNKKQRSGRRKRNLFLWIPIGFAGIGRRAGRRLCAVFVLVILGIMGCGSTRLAKEPESDIEVSITERADNELTEICPGIYESATEESVRKGKAPEGSTLGGLELAKRIVKGFGEYGYAAVDSENQVDMVNAEKVVRFCEQVDAKEEAELTIIVVLDAGGIRSKGFTSYELTAEDGEVTVRREYYQLEQEAVECISSTTYPAYSWQYTEEGYLFFRKYYMPGFDGPFGYTALRVQPLDETCRELNSRYILPVGYGTNDLFLYDWSEEDFGNIDFYDLFDKFYPIVYGRSMPYVADEDCGVGAIYRIPKEEFEHVIMARFNISSETLRSKTSYFSEDQTYEYRPRGLYDREPPEIPYPEVVSYVRNGDGTITLTVYAVWPYASNSKVFAHEVVVRPLEDGGVQYVSNRVIPSEDNCKATWHADRLTEEKWEELFPYIQIR